MPHSSGGGHHGGGHHGGHHSSHHSSHGGGSGGSRQNNHILRSTHFAGSRRYVRYRDKKPEYLYANYDITGKSYKLAKKVFLTFLAVILMVMAIILVTTIRPPRKIMIANGTPGIEDTIDKFTPEEEENLLEVMNAFKQKTGITPYVMTVTNEEWEMNYLFSLERYAFDLYVNKFKDEAHWLLVYSEPKEITDSFVNWYWEGMQGDDTDPIITEKIADMHTQILHKNLLANSRYSVAEAIQDAFEQIMPDLMKPGITDETMNMLMSMLSFLVFTCFFGYMFIGPMKPNNTGVDGFVPCPEQAEAKEIVCDYCQGVYIHGTVTSCPHCGAPVLVMKENEENS